MEPPPKRLRILQSIDVDETNPDYVLAKQTQHQKFKGRLESIFAKYENMHESMSDEIDMKTNKLVVDRGHLRRLNRQVTRKETMLLDHLLERGPVPEDGPDTEGEDDTEDELAPSREPKPHAEASTEEPRQTYTREPHTNHLGLQSPNNPSSDMPQVSAPQIPNTPNPAANLLQFVQFPQTPEGQQAQHAFYSTLTMTINQAVQQAVAPLFSNILGHSPTMQTPFAQSLPTPSVPMTVGDTITPAKDPKWLFPPLPDRLPNHEAAQSSPIPTPANNPTVLKSNPQAPQRNYKRKEQDREIPETTPVQVLHKAREPIAHIQCQPSRPRQNSPRVEIQRRRTSMSKQYTFTKEDDIYISQRRTFHNETWTKIKTSRDKWKDWPLSIFWQHWHNHLKKQNLCLTHPPSAGSVAQCDSTLRGQQFVAPESPTATHDLLTPTSLEHEEDSRRREVPESDFEPEPESEPEPDSEPDKTHKLQEIPESSNAHYDDDELELLSLAGGDSDSEPPLVEDSEPLPAPEDIALPSIEPADFIDEDTIIQQQLLDLDDSAIENQACSNPPASPPTIPSSIKRPITSSTGKKRQTPPPITFQADADSDADSLDLIATPRIKSELPSQSPLSLPPPLSSSKPLLPLSTPAALLKTPNSSNSTISSAVKMSRRKFLKQVKQSWSAKGKGKKRKGMSMGGVQRRASLDGGSRRKVRVCEEEDSEDELAR